MAATDPSAQRSVDLSATSSPASPLAVASASASPSGSATKASPPTEDVNPKFRPPPHAEEDFD
ncbi:hypothetical protein BGW38_000676, partial [Lunasporangiospora selenospora]